MAVADLGSLASEKGWPLWQGRVSGRPPPQQTLVARLLLVHGALRRSCLLSSAVRTTTALRRSRRRESIDARGNFTKTYKNSYKNWGSKVTRTPDV